MRGLLRNRPASVMSDRKRILIAAQDQLMFGHSLAAMCVALQDLRAALPDSFVVQLLDERINRKRANDKRANDDPVTSPWAA